MANKKKTIKKKVDKKRELGEKAVRPTVKLKQSLVLKKISENGGNASKAMRESGYSDTYAKTPAKLVTTKSFQALLKEFLPEDKLAEVHRQQLNSWKLNSIMMQKQIEDNDIYELLETVGCVVKKIVDLPTGRLVFYIQPDNQSRNKALEMAWKLNKKLTDKVEIKDTTPFKELSDTELAERIKKNKDFFTKK